jgi:D-sedoheptulose 7-phosphate isomerase
MSDGMRGQLDDHVRTALAADVLLPEIGRVGALLCERFAQGHILYTFGNGGSAADAQHFTGEVIGHYKRDRRPLGAVTLSTDPTTMTCIANDYSYDDVFARQVTALAAARDAGATTVLFGGGDGGPARAHADYALLAPSTVTPRIQELHTFMLHAISEMVDAWAADEEVEA